MERWGSSSVSPKFSFAFNDRKFSDRILRIEVVGSRSSITLDEVTAARGSEWEPNRKCWLIDPKKDPAVEAIIDFGDEEDEIMVQREADGGAVNDDKPVPMIEEASPQDQMLASICENDFQIPGVNASWTMVSPAVSRVKPLHISSAILAAESRFFFKLFSNGMRESEQRDVTLRINASEEAALMDMLQFMYTGRLEASSSPALLDVLMTADKFEVASCMYHCSKLLGKLPMTPDAALLYLDLPSSMILSEATQPLTDAARSFLISQYKDILRFQDDVMRLPLAGIEALFSSDELQVASEDSVYDFVLKWAKSHYYNIEERKEVLGCKLASLVRFPLMTSRKLRKVLASLELDQDIASKFVLEALFYKSEPPHRQRQLAMEDPACKKYSERAYKYRPVKVLEFERPFAQCIVFLDLKKEECVALYPQGRVYSQAFHLGGQGFFLSAHCNMDQAANFHCFGLFLGMQEKGSTSFSVDYEFSARGKPSGEFMMKYRGTYKFTGGKAVGYRNLFGMPWSEFVAEECIYFIEDVLHLRAELTVRVGVDM